jgi:hypothetical protein
MTVSKSVASFVSGIRSSADKLKDIKGTISSRVVAKISGLAPQFQDVALVYSTTAAILDTVATLAAEITNDVRLKEATKTLVENYVQDAANRINEFANIVELSVTNKAVKESTDKVTVLLGKIEDLKKNRSAKFAEDSKLHEETQTALGKIEMGNSYEVTCLDGSVKKISVLNFTTSSVFGIDLDSKNRTRVYFDFIKFFKKLEI